MNQKGLAPILIVLILAALVGGYLIYQKQTKTASTSQSATQSAIPSPTPYPQNWKLNKQPDLNQTTNWLTYKNGTYKFEVKYPNNWSTKTGSQVFYNGTEFKDLILIGSDKKDKNQGSVAFFVVGDPVKTNLDIKSWLREIYKPETNPDNSPYEFSEETINGIKFDKVFVCGLGCLTHYHTRNGDYIYSFILQSGPVDENADPKEEGFKQNLVNILYTFKFLK